MEKVRPPSERTVPLTAPDRARQSEEACRMNDPEKLSPAWDVTVKLPPHVITVSVARHDRREILVYIRALAVAGSRETRKSDT
jgi:hypothetical protein